MASRLDLFQQFLEWEASDTTTEGTTEGSELTDGHEVDSDSGSPSGNECTSGAEQYLTKRAPGKKATLASKKFRVSHEYIVSTLVCVWMCGVMFSIL